MKRTLSFFLSLFMTASLLVALLPASSASAAKDEPVSEPWESFDALPEDPFSGSYTEFDGKDGTKTRVYDNGGVMTKYKDGSETSVDYQGNCYTTAPDGSYSVRTADGCSATAYSDGRQSWTTPDGKTTTVNPDGSSSETFACGLVKDYDEDGGLVGVGFAGSDERIRTDKHGDLRDGKIKGPDGASMEIDDDGDSVKIVTSDGTKYEYKASGIADSADGRKEITTVTEPDGTVATMTETKTVNRDGSGNTTGSTGSVLTEISAGGNKYQAETVTEYDPDGNAVYNPQNVTQYVGSDGSTYWTDNNSKAVEYTDPNTGEKFALDKNGNLTDLVNGDVTVKTTYGADGSVVSSEWTWKDGATYTVTGGEGGTFVTPDGTTYTTDGKGNVYENGKQIKKDGEWLNGQKKSGSSGSDPSGESGVTVENPFADYYTDRFVVEVSTGGTVVDPAYSKYWSVDTFNLFVDEAATGDQAANGEGRVLIEYPKLFPAEGGSVMVCGRMENMTGWEERDAENIVDLLRSRMSFDGTGTIPERRAAYAYVEYGDQYFMVIYDSYIPVKNVPNVYIEYSLTFKFPVGTALEDALRQIEPYDDAAKATKYTVEWVDPRFLIEPDAAKKTEKEEEKKPRGFVDPVGYFAMTSSLTASELQNMMYTIDEYYLVPIRLYTHGSFAFFISKDGSIPFEASPVVADGKTKYTISGAASNGNGSDSIELKLTNLGRRGSFYKFQADVTGQEVVIESDGQRREFAFDNWWTSEWGMRDGAPVTNIVFNTIYTDENGKESASSAMATITFRIAGIKPTGRSEAYLKEHDIESVLPSGGSDDEGYPDTALGIVGVSLATALIGGAAGVAVSAAGSIAGAAAAEAAAAAGEAAGSAFGGLDLGPHISVDDDGDLNVKDPATGEKRLYTSNGDGTYTNPLTGATYTPAELKSSLESREENADLIRQDEAVREEAVAKQAEDNKNVSFYDAEAKAEKAAAEAEAAHELYKEKMYFKHGVEEGDDKGVKRDILEKTNEAYEEQAKYEARAEYADAGYETAKETKQAADIAIDVMAEIDTTGVGKVIKDGYAVASATAGNMGEAMAGEKSIGDALTQSVVDSTVELAKNHTDSVAGKYAANIFGDSAKEMTKEALKGGSLEDIRKAGEKGAIGGAVNATVDVGFDGAGKLASSAMKDGGKAIGKAFGQEITKESAANAAKTLAGDAVKNALGDDD